MEKVLHYTKTIDSLVRCLKSSSKVLFTLNFFFMVPFIVVLGAQI